MNRTNRSGQYRMDLDFYPTPVKVIEHFLDIYKIQSGNILEPSAGCGNILEGLKLKGYTNNITSIEIREEEKNNLTKYGDVYIADFLNWQPDKQYKTIIGNPPYRKAQEFMEKCFEIANEDTEIIMLLRTAFLESKKRYEFWQKHPVNKIYILSTRPSFTGNGTDSASYAWFIWNNSNKQEIKVI
jgi:hypothetical protein